MSLAACLKIDPESEINDIRNLNHFRCITFSEFKKTDVKRVLLESITQGKIEPACYWSAELLCSGHTNDLWDVVLSFYGKHVHYGNPKFCIYIDMRMKKFKEILHQYYTSDELRMRNHDGIRKIFAELITFLCFAKRKNTFDDIKIKRNEFEADNLQDKLKAPNFRYCEGYTESEDPQEIVVAINELCFHIANKNTALCYYWIQWMVDLDALHRQTKHPLVGARRLFAAVEPKYQKDVVFCVWQVLLQKAEAQENILISKIMKSLLNMFSYKYIPGNAKRRIYFMFFGVTILIEKLSYEDEIMLPKEKQIAKEVLDKIDNIYKQIKRNEHSPRTTYLFGPKGEKEEDAKKSNFDQTISNLETMDSLSTTLIPRI